MAPKLDDLLRSRLAYLPTPRGDMRTHPSLLLAVVLALACGVAALPRSSGAAADGPPAVSTAGPAPVAARSTWNLRQTPVVEVVRRVKDAVVNIHSERTVKAGGADELFTL